MTARRFVVCSAIVLGLAAASGQIGSPPRFQGLERLYFERAADPAKTAWRAEQVRCLLAERLQPPGACERVMAEVDDLFVSDIPLTVGQQVVLRQVHDRSHRITEQWWCLYGDGRRSECWFFAPDPRRSEGKALAEYDVQEVLTPEPGRLVFRTCGAMFRPQGAWWWQAKDFAFTVSGPGLRFDHVVGRFFFSRGYDLGDKEPPLSVSTERPLPGSTRLETRSVDPVTDAMTKRCDYRDPILTDEEMTCDQLERMASCLTADRAATVQVRERSMPSFIERGSKR